MTLILKAKAPNYGAPKHATYLLLSADEPSSPGIVLIEHLSERKIQSHSIQNALHIYNSIALSIMIWASCLWYWGTFFTDVNVIRHFWMKLVPGQCGLLPRRYVKHQRCNDVQVQQTISEGKRLTLHSCWRTATCPQWPPCLQLTSVSQTALQHRLLNITSRRSIYRFYMCVYTFIQYIIFHIYMNISILLFRTEYHRITGW